MDNYNEEIRNTLQIAKHNAISDASKFPVICELFSKNVEADSDYEFPEQEEDS